MQTKTLSKLTSVFLCAVMLFSTLSLAACTSDDTPDYADKDFINAVSKGLQQRWTILGDKEMTVSLLTKAVQAEIDAVSEFSTRPFQDTELQEKALSYINILNESKEKIDYCFSLDFDELDEWTRLYNERTMLIVDFYNNYGLKVSANWQDTLDELMVNGKTAEADKAQLEAVQAIVNALEFKLVENDYGFKTYEAVFDNTTEYDFECISLTINLLDADGVIVETNYADASNVKAGQKAKMEFMTDVDFDRYEITVDYY